MWMLFMLLTPKIREFPSRRRSSNSSSSCPYSRRFGFIMSPTPPPPCYTLKNDQIRGLQKLACQRIYDGTDYDRVMVGGHGKKHAEHAETRSPEAHARAHERFVSMKRTVSSVGGHACAW
ncbi:hypothetical protein BaRGS_00032731, partial [Batillaria attramentaria]